MQTLVLLGRRFISTRQFNKMAPSLQVLAAAAAGAELRLVGTPPAPGAAPQGPPVEAKGAKKRLLASRKLALGSGRSGRGLSGPPAPAGLGGRPFGPRRVVESAPRAPGRMWETMQCVQSSCSMAGWEQPLGWCIPSTVDPA